ncbi:MAG: gallidermin/nisin family lantibiotic [Agathobacter sp.]|nr:gallidermin/nisin family lantibiotic [Agathobacter sp.]
MSKLNDFDLDVTTNVKDSDVSVQWKSKSLCTPGCITGILMGCNLQTVSCNCSIKVSK